MRVRPVKLGEFIGREGSYFLSRKKGEQKIFSFEDPTISLTRGHILGEKPPPNGYQPHPSDVDSLEDAQELHLTDFAKIATGFEDYIFPPTLNRSAIATLLVDSTPGGMMRAVMTCVLATGSLPKTPTIPPDGKQEGLACAAFDTRNTDGTTDESNLAQTIAPVVTRKGKQRILHHPPTLKRRDNPTYGATRDIANPNTCGTTPRTQNEKLRDQGTPEPMFPTQETASRQRQLLVRANIKAHTQPRYNGSQTFSANRRNSRAFLRVPKAQEIHQPACHRAASSLPKALGSPRNGRP